MTEIRLTHLRAKEALHYDPVLGIVTWRVKPKHRPIKIGDRAGYVGTKGYRLITIDGEEFLEHRLIWFWMTSEWVPQIDHRDTHKANNKWDNLREADNFQNQSNVGITANNSSGFKGVTSRKFASGTRYIAQISHKNKVIHLGIFETPEEAHAAYCAAAKRLKGDFANSG